MAKYRSIFVSDVHLGTIPCKARQLDHFLKENTCENLYLVGDIVDGWLLRREYFWPQSHTDVVRRILTIARNGAKVYYISGNHDEVLRSFSSYELSFGKIQIVDEAVHETASGKRVMVVHGDIFDNLIATNALAFVLNIIGVLLYKISFNISRLVNFILSPFRKVKWSLTETVKRVLRLDALASLCGFKNRAVKYAKKNDCDAIICGHTHVPGIEVIDDVIYMNDGDWVDSMTAIVEHHDGTFELIDYRRFVRAR